MSNNLTFKDVDQGVKRHKAEIQYKVVQIQRTSQHLVKTTKHPAFDEENLDDLLQIIINAAAAVKEYQLMRALQDTYSQQEAAKTHK